MIARRTTLAALASALAVATLAGCATRGARSGGRGGAIVGPEVAARATSFPSNVGRAALPRRASLRTDTPSWTEPPAPVYVVVPPGYGAGPAWVGSADYGPAGSAGESASWSDAPGAYPAGGFFVVPGGAVPPGLRPPHDAGHDATGGLAGAIQGSSPYRDPGDSDGDAHRPGLSTGSGVFDHPTHAERAGR